MCGSWTTELTLFAIKLNFSPEYGKFGVLHVQARVRNAWKTAKVPRMMNTTKSQKDEIRVRASCEIHARIIPTNIAPDKRKTQEGRLNSHIGNFPFSTLLMNYILHSFSLAYAGTFQLCSISTCVVVAIKYKCCNRLAAAAPTTESPKLLS